ncbi:MAG: hypothetical protein BBJ57_13695 [Desulfobacterales bacterium PC51MH44]|nr:MAG: hypothetical protein BBJ57_13695 [Desulfobacterales bacterium PC51MH44]
MQIFFWAFGVLGILLFHQGIYLPIVISATVIAMAAWHLIRLYRQSRVGPLTILLFVAYALPFIHVFPYIWFDFDAESPLILWGLAVNPYMTDKTIIELMSMIGAVGATGFAVGASLFKRKVSMASSSEMVARYPAFGKTFSLPVFYTWVAIAIAFTWISAPANTIFTAVYTQSIAINAGWNFSSAWMVSYGFLLFTLADSMFETSQKIGKLKRKIVLYTFLLIVIWFQLLRGDREAIPCVIGALLMYYVWGKGLLISVKDRVKIKSSALFLAVFVIAVVSYFFGILRSALVGVDSISDLLNVLIYLVKSGTIRFDNLIAGTWSGVLLTPLSVAGDYINGTLSINYGQTYLDLLASIVPGFIADWIGYSRPISGLAGPAWQMTYGIGGTHAVVVPFIDFRMVGVFIIVALWSFVFAKIERYSIKRLTVSNLALLGIIAMAIPHWLWYGEKNIMNALIIWLFLSIFYRVQLVNSAKKTVIRSKQPAGSSF